MPYLEVFLISSYLTSHGTTLLSNYSFWGDIFPGNQQEQEMVAGVQSCVKVTVNDFGFAPLTTQEETWGREAENKHEVKYWGEVWGLLVSFKHKFLPVSKCHLQKFCSNAFIFVILVQKLDLAPLRDFQWVLRRLIPTLLARLRGCFWGCIRERNGNRWVSELLHN